MGRNKFEDQLKKQLQGREIQPSEGAWDRISEQLEVPGSSGTALSKSHPLHWYAIAAGFIGILFVSVLYFTSKEPSATPQIEITDTMTDSVTIEEQRDILKKDRRIKDDAFANTDDLRKNNSEENAVASTNTPDDTMNSAHSHTGIPDKNSIRTTSRINGNKPINEATASSGHDRRELDKVAATPNMPEALLDAKVAEIVAQVEILEYRNRSVTDAEIDSLLRDAQQEILEDRIFRQDRSVDAMALLADVEDELDQSFRDRIFDALKDGFLKVRTAVADRNK